MGKWLLHKLLTIIVFLLLFALGMILSCLCTDWNDPAYAIDRCQQYAQEVRTQHFKYFGLNFPYWYGIAQIRQESNCRANATAFDAGQGLSQFMPTTKKLAEKYLGELDMYNPAHAIKAQAWYMYQLDKANIFRLLWLTYCFYNSGQGQMMKEYRRAGALDYDLMRAICKRKVYHFQTHDLDLCDVGYDYPKQVYKFGQVYKAGKDERRFW